MWYDAVQGRKSWGRRKEIEESEESEDSEDGEDGEDDEVGGRSYNDIMKRGELKLMWSL